MLNNDLEELFHFSPWYWDCLSCWFNILLLFDRSADFDWHLQLSICITAFICSSSVTCLSWSASQRIQSLSWAWGVKVNTPWMGCLIITGHHAHVHTKGQVRISPIHWITWRKPVWTWREHMKLCKDNLPSSSSRFNLGAVRWQYHLLIHRAFLLPLYPDSKPSLLTDNIFYLHCFVKVSHKVLSRVHFYLWFTPGSSIHHRGVLFHLNPNVQLDYTLFLNKHLSSPCLHISYIVWQIISYSFTQCLLFTTGHDDTIITRFKYSSYSQPRTGLADT